MRPPRASHPRLRRLFFGLWGLSLITILARPVFAQLQYTAYDLGPGVARGINNAGTVVGYKVTPEAVHAFSYCNGQMTDLGTLGGFESFGLDINDAGIVTGSSFLNFEVILKAFSYSDGVMTDLGDLGGGGSEARAINNEGTIVGDSCTPPYGDIHAFSYSGGHMIDLGTLGGRQSVAYGISSKGIIVGSSNYEEANRLEHAFSYSNSHMTDLGTLGGNESRAFGINSGGVIVGHSETSGGGWHAFRYVDSHIMDLGFEGVASAINDAGVIVGGNGHAFCYNNGVLTDLSGHLAGVGLTGASTANAINENGDIAGSAAAADGTEHAFLLVATPKLFIEAMGTNVAVSWFTNASTGFSLFKNTSVASTGWTAVTNAPVVTNHQYRVVISSSVSGNCFYRLQSR